MAKIMDKMKAKWIRPSQALRTKWTTKTSIISRENGRQRFLPYLTIYFVRGSCIPPSLSMFPIWVLHIMLRLCVIMLMLNALTIFFKRCYYYAPLCSHKKLKFFRERARWVILRCDWIPDGRQDGAILHSRDYALCLALCLSSWSR